MTAKRAAAAASQVTVGCLLWADQAEWTWLPDASREACCEDSSGEIQAFCIVSAIQNAFSLKLFPTRKRVFDS